MLLPLSLEIVATDISLCDSEAVFASSQSGQALGRPGPDCGPQSGF